MKTVDLCDKNLDNETLQKSLEQIDEVQDIELDVSYNNITDLSSLEALAAKIVKLNISATGKITDFSVLSKIKNLQSLSLEGHELKNLDDIPALPNLTELKLGCSGVASENFSIDANKFPKLHTVSLAENSELKRISSLPPTIRNLDISGTSLRDVTSLGELKYLEQLTFYDAHSDTAYTNIDTKSLMALAKLTNLRKITILSNDDEFNRVVFENIINLLNLEEAEISCKGDSEQINYGRQQQINRIIQQRSERQQKEKGNVVVKSKNTQITTPKPSNQPQKVGKGRRIWVEVEVPASTSQTTRNRNDSTSSQGLSTVPSEPDYNPVEYLEKMEVPQEWEPQKKELIAKVKRNDERKDEELRRKDEKLQSVEKELKEYKALCSRLQGQQTQATKNNRNNRKRNIRAKDTSSDTYRGW